MTLYANTPARRWFQVIVDLALVVWVVALVWLGWVIGSAVRGLSSAGDQLADGGTTFSQQMNELAQKAGSIPLVGQELQAPFGAAAGAGGNVRAAGESFSNSITRVGWLLTVAIAVGTVFVAVLLWVIARLPWVLRARRAQRQLLMPGGEILLGWEALNSSSPASLLAIHPDPVHAWRAGDMDTTNQLAALRLRQLGLAPMTTWQATD